MEEVTFEAIWGEKCSRHREVVKEQQGGPCGWNRARGSSWDQTPEVLLHSSRSWPGPGSGPGSGMETNAGVQGIIWLQSPQFCRWKEVGREGGREGGGEIRYDSQVWGSFFPSQEKSSGEFWPQTDGETRRRLGHPASRRCRCALRRPRSHQLLATCGPDVPSRGHLRCAFPSTLQAVSVVRHLGRLE